MAKNNNINDFMKDVADAIRTKTNKTNKINPQNFSSEILGIKSGIKPEGVISIEENGTYDVTEYGTAEVNVQGGEYNIVQVDTEDGTELHIYDADNGTHTPSTPTGKGEYSCKVVDFDGTIIAEEFLSEGDVFTLPQSPIHSGLTFQQWSSPFAIENNKIEVSDSDVIVGAIYTTTSGKSEFDIELNANTGLDFVLTMDGTKDWGDGTINTETTHKYTSYGNYTVTCDGSTMTDSASGLFLQKSQSAYRYICKRARLGSNITNIVSYAFNNCYSLEYITIPKEVVNIGANAICGSEVLHTVVLPLSITDLSDRALGNNTLLTNIVVPVNVTLTHGNAFAGCYNLHEIILPDQIPYISINDFTNCYSLNKIRTGNISYVGDRAFQSTIIREFVKESVTRIGVNSFYGCKNLAKVKLSDSVTLIPDYAFQECSALSDFELPSSLQGISINAFYKCTALRKINFPATCNSISSKSFYYCPNIREYNFSNHEVVPTLSASDAFSGISDLTKIIVPDKLYDEWITSTNWSTYANYIYKASEVDV